MSHEIYKKNIINAIYFYSIFFYPYIQNSEFFGQPENLTEDIKTYNFANL